MEKGQGADEKICFWYEVSVKDGNNLSLGTCAPLLERAGFVPRPILAMVQGNINAFPSVARYQTHFPHEFRRDFSAIFFEIHGLARCESGGVLSTSVPGAGGTPARPGEDGFATHQGGAGV
jgi:hypothetical protein